MWRSWKLSGPPSVIESYPIRSVLPGGGEELLHAPVVPSVPGIVPPAAHVAIDGVPYSKFLEPVQEVTERKIPGAIDYTKFSADFAQGPVAVDPFGLDASLEALPVMEEHALAESHPSFLGDSPERRFGVLVGVVVEMPSALDAPGKDSVVRTAFVTLLEIPRRDVVSGYVRMLELVQPLPSKGCGTYEDHVILAFERHLFRNEIDSLEMGIIDSQAVVILDRDTLRLASDGESPQDQGEC